jgi:hypothetical protein
MVYRGPYRVRVEEKPEPRVEHPNDAIVRVTDRAFREMGLGAELKYGLASRRGRGRNDVKHHLVDALVLTARYAAMGAVAYGLISMARNRRRRQLPA